MQCKRYADDGKSVSKLRTIRSGVKIQCPRDRSRKLRGRCQVYAKDDRRD